MNKIVNITALAVLIAAGLSGCVDDDDGFGSSSGATYTSVSDCVSNGNSQAVCQQAFDQAQAEAAKAPHFATGNDCYAKYGPDGCRQYTDSSGNSWFMPFMMGYMLGNNNGYHPIYRSYGGGYQTVIVNNGVTSYSNVSSVGGGARATVSTGSARASGGYSSGSATTSARGGFGGGSSGSSGG